MQDFQKEFIDLAINRGVLCFGEFTLKSGRVSPYFFNAGKFDTGLSMAVLGKAYAAAIVASGVEFDMIFGPAYKGIPLAAVTSAALSEHHQLDIPFAYNRKEAKSHGEGGVLVGAPLSGKVLIIDDVITAGTAIREVAEIIEAGNASVAGVVIGLNRLERGKQALSAVQEVERDFNAPVVSIIDLNDVIDFVGQSAQVNQDGLLERIQAYRLQYGVES